MSNYSNVGYRKQMHVSNYSNLGYIISSINQISFDHYSSACQLQFAEVVSFSKLRSITVMYGIEDK